MGDSRAYLITRQGAIWPITQDHTLVASLVAIGQLSPADAERHPQRSLLYRCVGQSPALEVDGDVRRLEAGDRILICSDGLTRHLAADEIAAQVLGHEAPELSCTRLVNLANDRGGEDNISVIVIRADDPQGDQHV